MEERAFYDGYPSLKFSITTKRRRRSNGGWQTIIASSMVEETSQCVYGLPTSSMPEKEAAGGVAAFEGD